MANATSHAGKHFFFLFFFLHYTRFISDDLATCLTDDGLEPPVTLNNVNPILNFLYTQTSLSVGSREVTVEVAL